MRFPWVLALSMVLLSGMMAGCIKPDPDFDSPVSSIPKLLVDHVDNTTKIYIKALDDHRYENISIRVEVDNETRISMSEENVFMDHISVELESFTLNVTVQDKKKLYAFESNLTLYPPDHPPDVVLLISSVNEEGKIKEKTVKENDLPWRTLIERVE